MFSRNSKEPVVITFGELFMMLALTGALMVLFFPKARIEQGIETEKSNYDLTLVYLKSIAHAYPNDPQNWLRLLDAELSMGKTEAAQQIFAQLKRFPDIDKSSLDYMGYKLLKTRYFQTAEAWRKEELRTLLARKLEEFISSDESSLWLIARQEATELQMPRLVFAALKKRITRGNMADPDDVAALLRLAPALHRVSEALTLAETALRQSGDRRIYMLLKKECLAAEDYAACAKISRLCYERCGDAEAFLDAAKYLFWAKKPKEARALLRSGEARFLHDPQTAQKIIRLYLANGMTAEAHRYTLQLLEAERVLP